MTTAHRPTWAPAKGGEEQGGSRWFVSTRQASAKNQPGHLNLKYRQDGQGSSADLGSRDLRAELLLKERQAAAKRRPGHVADFDEERRKDLLLLEGAGGGDPGKGGGGPGGGGAGAGARLVPKALDADDEDPDKDDSDSDDDDDDDDDEEALMAELERIKKERAEEAAKKAKAEAEAQTKERAEEVVRGNPLLALAGGEPSFSIKRRWDNDVVFKNQTRGEPKAQKRFINDTIRNDFHKRFLHRYVR